MINKPLVILLIVITAGLFNVPKTSAWSGNLPVCTGITFGQTQIDRIKADYSSYNLQTDSFVLAKKSDEFTQGYFVFIQVNDPLVFDTPSTDFTVLKTKAWTSANQSRRYMFNNDGSIHQSTGNQTTSIYSLSCITYAQNTTYATSYVGSQYPVYYTPPPPPEPCQYNSQILATDPACVAPPPEPEPEPEPEPANNKITFVQKASAMIAFAISGYIVYQARFTAYD